MKKGIRLASAVFLGALSVSSLSGQARQLQVTRRPPAVPDAQQSQKREWDGPVFVLDGMPMLMQLHHDTEAAAGRWTPICCDEMQIMNQTEIWNCRASDP